MVRSFAVMQPQEKREIEPEPCNFSGAHETVREIKTASLSQPLLADNIDPAHDEANMGRLREERQCAGGGCSQQRGYRGILSNGK